MHTVRTPGGVTSFYAFLYGCVRPTTRLFNVLGFFHQVQYYTRRGSRTLDRYRCYYEYLIDAKSAKKV